MIKDTYLLKIKEIIKNNPIDNCKYFIYGSSIKKEDFGDIDIGLIGSDISSDYVFSLKDSFESSTFPYKVDIIDFNKVDKDFKENVFKEEILWLT